MPESYWQPFLGELSLSPSDLGGLTPQQMDSCFDHYTNKAG